MKLGTWNVNGVRAVVKKDFEGWLASSGLDVLGLQETKAQDDQAVLLLWLYGAGGPTAR